jgi:hypothetical protein
MCSGCWDYVTSLFKKRTKAMLVVGCIPIAVFFPTSSGLDQKYAVAVAVQHPGYIVGILSLWQDCCYYRATTPTRNKLYCI